MRVRGLFLAAAVVLAASGVTLGLVATNRSGTPDATIELTERELRLMPADTENTSLAFALDWQPRWYWEAAARSNAWSWFDRARLESIGFDCRYPLDARDASGHYSRLPARSTYAVLEYEGDSWQRRLAQPIPPPASPTTGPGGAAVSAADPLLESRLTVIDVGNDRTRLRAQYPDQHRYVLVTAIARVELVARQGAAPVLQGRVTAVWPAEIHVPREHRAAIDGLTPSTDRPGPLRGTLPHQPRYRVTLAYGRNLEPWIVKIERQ